MEILNWILDSMGWLMLLLIAYVILFRVYYATEGERPLWLWPAAAVFLFADVAINLVVMSVFMVDLPEEWTVTERMKRYKKIRDTTNALKWYRFHFAESMCMILNVFDKSKDGHC
jgi:hypothetical protein